MITPLPGATPLVPGSCTLPFPGIAAAIVDEAGNDVPNGQGGILVVKKPWPEHDPHHLGRPRALQGELLPAGAEGLLPGRRRRDPRRGHRLLHDHRPHRRRAQRQRPPHGHDGDRVGAGVVHRAGGRGRGGRPARRDHRRGDLRLRRAQAQRGRPATRRRRSPTSCATGSAKEIGPIAKPKDIRFGDNLPKTRSGKIMRRLLRSIAKGEAITQDTSTLENPAILEQLARELNSSNRNIEPWTSWTDLTTRIAARPEVPGAEVQALALRLVADAGDDGRVLRLHPAGGLRQAVPRDPARRGRHDDRHADRPGRHRLHDRHHRASTCGAPTASTTR